MSHGLPCFISPSALHPLPLLLFSWDCGEEPKKESAFSLYAWWVTLLLIAHSSNHSSPKKYRGLQFRQIVTSSQHLPPSPKNKRTKRKRINYLNQFLSPITQGERIAWIKYIKLSKAWWNFLQKIWYNKSWTVLIPLIRIDKKKKKKKNEATPYSFKSQRFMRTYKVSLLSPHRFGISEYCLTSNYLFIKKQKGLNKSLEREREITHIFNGKNKGA